MLYYYTQRLIKAAAEKCRTDREIPVEIIAGKRYDSVSGETISLKISRISAESPEELEKNLSAFIQEVRNLLDSGKYTCVEF